MWEHEIEVVKEFVETSTLPKIEEQKIENSFGNLRDEEECFDTELGMWEHEIEVVKEFVETSTLPKIEDYDAWSENMKKYFDGLTKMNGMKLRWRMKIMYNNY
ncbi:hypothetical protein Hanom_Chr10g00926511 [Helianthus anomalus]